MKIFQFAINLTIITESLMRSHDGDVQNTGTKRILILNTRVGIWSIWSQMVTNNVPIRII
jgi:hypothetical protein